MAICEGCFPAFHPVSAEVTLKWKRDEKMDGGWNEGGWNEGEWMDRYFYITRLP